MSKSIVLSLLGALALGSALLSGCGDSDKKPAAAATGPQSAAGESCVRSADCAAGLVCFSNVCATSPTVADGGVPLTPGGAAGESCQAHSDCQNPLGCYNGICAAMPTGDAGVTVQLGQRGESCQAAKDCASGLTCLPVSTGFGIVSICDIAKYPPPAPSGMVCGECKTADDCCELPASLEGVTTYSTPGAINSCADVADLLMGVTCATTTNVQMQQLCFIQATYCTCAANTWACTDNQCQYTASCKGAGGIAKSGCPLETRTGHALFSICDSATGGSLKCAPAATTVSGCTSDDDCAANTMNVADDTSGDTCSAGECACVVATGLCFRKCARDIDCPASQIGQPAMVCDVSGTSLCVEQPGCKVDADCVNPATNLDVTAVCDTTTSQCRVPCVTDHDCSGSGVTGAIVTGSVCSAGLCTLPSECTSDDQCSTLIGGRRTFCVAGVAPATTVTVHSAVTGGNGK